ncbi:MAG: discoidin domain-containing protein [Phycisphaerae bacterium]|nr:discoidin domain-containing protein [Phycisphaerae bacterium]
MKSFEIPMVVVPLVGLCLLCGPGMPAAYADLTFGAPTNLGAPVNSSIMDCGPCVLADDLELYFHREVPDGEIYVARRSTPDDEWGEPVNLGPTVNSPGYDGGPCLSADGLSLYFFSDRPGGFGNKELWVTTRATTKNNWSTPANLGASVNAGFDAWSPSITADGLELYFTSSRPGGYGDSDIWVTTRATVNDNWGLPVNLGPTVNTSFQENWPGISPDGLVLFFGTNRTETMGTWDIFMARRATRKDPWGFATTLGAAVDRMATWQVGGKISPGGSMLYFHSPRPGGVGGCDIWQTPIVPIVDFNGDGNVDAADLAILVANWGKNTSWCDVGPFPWGDGVVDEKDLKVLMESLMTPGPRASEVPCDVVLSWVPPSFSSRSGTACDVYFGTSPEAVSSASRTHLQGVLVSQGQTAATYDPPGRLEYNRTYYWRVDFVILGPTPAIYQGPVLSFTTAATEAFASPIKNVTATASSSQPLLGPERTVDGSGLDQNDRHSTNGADMWLSVGTAPQWIQYEFDRVYALHELWVWNSNQLAETSLGFGAKTIKIEYSTDGTKWTPLADVSEFARAPGQPGYVHNTTVNFGGASAKYIKLTIENNWGGAPQTGLSEVRFFYIPDRSATKP